MTAPFATAAEIAAGTGMLSALDVDDYSLCKKSTA